MYNFFNTCTMNIDQITFLKAYFHFLVNGDANFCNISDWAKYKMHSTLLSDFWSDSLKASV